MTQRVAIMGGGDWVDASVDLVNLPESVNLTEADSEYQQWKKENWSNGNYTGYEGKFLGFAEWLRVFKGATDSDVEEYWPHY